MGQDLHHEGLQEAQLFIDDTKLTKVRMKNALHFVLFVSFFENLLV
jgi:hypothetical protein